MIAYLSYHVPSSHLLLLYFIFLTGIQAANHACPPNTMKQMQMLVQ